MVGIILFILPGGFNCKIRTCCPVWSVYDLMGFIYFLNRNQWSVSWYKTQLLFIWNFMFDTSLPGIYDIGLVLLLLLDLYQLKYESRIN